jgi:twitching motility protein PilJ
MARSTDFAQEYQQAEKAYMQGRYEEAAEVVDRLVGEHPQDPSARLLRGHIYCYGLQRYDVAQEQYQTVLDLTQDAEFVDYANSGLTYAQQSAEEMAVGGIGSDPETGSLNGSMEYGTAWQDGDGLDSFMLADMDFEDDNSAGFTVESPLQTSSPSNFGAATPTIPPTMPPAMTNIMDDLGVVDESPRSKQSGFGSDPFGSFEASPAVPLSGSPFGGDDGFMDLSWQGGDQDADVFSDFNDVFAADPGLSSGGLVDGLNVDRGEDTSSQGPNSSVSHGIPPAFPTGSAPFQETNDRWGNDEPVEDTMFMSGNDFGMGGMPDFMAPSMSQSTPSSTFTSPPEVDVAPARGNAMDFIDDFDEFDDLGNLAFGGVYQSFGGRRFCNGRRGGSDRGGRICGQCHERSDKRSDGLRLYAQFDSR